MSRIESILAGLVIALAVPAMLFLCTGLIALFTLPEAAISRAALIGLGVGGLLDAVFLRSWVRHVYDCSTVMLVAAYLFCSVVVLSMSMGVPFDLAPGILAGVYVGRRMRHAKAGADRARSAARRVGILTTAVVFVICCLSATIALINPTTPSELQGMLQTVVPLQLTITWPMVVGLIVFGGSALILLQYWLTRTATLFAYRLGRPAPIPNP